VTILRLLRLVGFGFDIAYGVDGSDGVTVGADASASDGVVNVVVAARR
jgi:hypothetical protein